MFYSPSTIEMLAEERNKEIYRGVNRNATANSASPLSEGLNLLYALVAAIIIAISLFMTSGGKAQAAAAIISAPTSTSCSIDKDSFQVSIFATDDVQECLFIF